VGLDILARRKDWDLSKGQVVVYALNDEADNDMIGVLFHSM
jgi:hypothetical protein